MTFRKASFKIKKHDLIILIEDRVTNIIWKVLEIKERPTNENK